MSNCSASCTSVRSPLIAAIATFALKADVWFRRGLLLMLSPDSRANLARCQAEAPLIALCRFPKPALHLDHWRTAKWSCSLEWGPLNEKTRTWDEKTEAYIDRDDLPKLAKMFRDMKGHCAFLKCLDDRAAGKVKHCYLNDKRWR